MKRMGGKWVMVALVMAGCGSDPVVRIDPSWRPAETSCLRLVVVPGVPSWERALRRVYRFTDGCPVVLAVEHRERIACNSRYNAAEKVRADFPHHFLRMEVRRGLRTLYTYYIDLERPADTEEVLDAFARLRKDLALGRE